MLITKNFRLSEFTKSDTAELLGIDNTKVPKDVIKNIIALCNNILQPLRDSVKCPININSGYRCLKLNCAVGGVPTSQHVTGCACDIKIAGYTPYEIAKRIIDLGLQYDQLILYPTFVHVSYSDRNRQQLLYNKSYSGKRI